MNMRKKSATTISMAKVTEKRIIERTITRKTEEMPRN
jgi:hypothetical protein